MSSFKDMVERDVKSVFLNTDEFAELHHVVYNEIAYDIPIILAQTTEKDRSVHVADHAQGIYLTTTTMYAAYSDMECVPEKGQRIVIGDIDYDIVESSCEMGQIALELEMYGE